MPTQWGDPRWQSASSHKRRLLREWQLGKRQRHFGPENPARLVDFVDQLERIPVAAARNRQEYLGLSVPFFPFQMTHPFPSDNGADGTPARRQSNWQQLLRPTGDFESQT